MLRADLSLSASTAKKGEKFQILLRRVVRRGPATHNLGNTYPPSLGGQQEGVPSSIKLPEKEKGALPAKGRRLPPLSHAEPAGEKRSTSPGRYKKKGGKGKKATGTERERTTPLLSSAGTAPKKKSHRTTTISPAVVGQKREKKEKKKKEST